MGHTLCLEQLHNCLFQPLYTCARTNLRVTYSGQTRRWSESTLILTNDSTIAITRLICVDQSQGLKSAKDREGEREGEIIEMTKAPLLRRAALKKRGNLKYGSAQPSLSLPLSLSLFLLGTFQALWLVNADQSGYIGSALIGQNKGALRLPTGLSRVSHT